MDHGDNQISALIAGLENADKRAIRHAVDALIACAADDPKLRAVLHQRLADPSLKNHWPLAYILASLPAPTQTVIKVLAQTLDHRDPDIRWAIALVLMRLAKTDASLLSDLVQLAANGTANQRRMAIYCLRDAGLNDQQRVATLLNSLGDVDPMVRVAVVTSFKNSPLDENGKRKLLECFSRDPDVRVRNAAAITLAQMGTPSEEFLAELSKALAGDNTQLKKSATAAFTLLENKRSAPDGG